MTSYNIYWAGDLFNFKDLCGNSLIADAMKTVSGGRFVALLPQDTEENAIRGMEIRNRDLELVFQADLLVANFDGADLDSGTVVEFIIAKMLDIPAVLLRTDFRCAGDRRPGSDPWNLMCSGFPRAASLTPNAMALYHKIRASVNDRSALHSAVCTEIARSVSAELDGVLRLPSLFCGSTEKARSVYRWAADFCGGDLRAILTDEAIDRIVSYKASKGLLR